MAQGARSAPLGPRTERELNAPTPMTLRLLGVIFLATVLPWMGAKVACNRRDAPLRVPGDLEATVLAERPKSAALELAQRAACGDYLSAAQLAAGPVLEELKAAAAGCEGAQAAQCRELRSHCDKVFTRAVLVSRRRDRASVRTESSGPNRIERYLMELKREQGRWAVMERRSLTEAMSNAVAPVPDAGL